MNDYLHRPDVDEWESIRVFSVSFVDDTGARWIRWHDGYYTPGKFTAQEWLDLTANGTIAKRGEQ